MAYKISELGEIKIQILCDSVAERDAVFATLQKGDCVWFDGKKVDPLSGIGIFTPCIVMLDNGKTARVRNSAAPTDYEVVAAADFVKDNTVTINVVSEAHRLMAEATSIFRSIGTKNMLADAPPTILREAENLIYGDRNEAYGTVTENFGRTAKLWSAVLSKKLNADISPEDVGMMMACLKIARHTHKPNRDNLVDAAGYLGCIEKLQNGE